MLHLPILVLLVTVPVATSSVPERTGSIFGFRINLTHVDTVGNFTKLELLHRSLTRATHRVESLVSNSADEFKAPVHAGTGEFLVDLTIGTPHLAFSAILDTGSDLIWTQCEPCQDCYNQSTPIFDPSKSSTFSNLPCSSSLCNALPSSTCNPDCEYLYSYGDYSSTQGVLATETLTFGSVSIPKIGFGCGESNQGSGFKQGSGLVGLGRGPLSLISQLGLGKFSYCLTALGESKRSPLLFGSLASFNSSEKNQVHTTPLVKNPSKSSFYYLTLKDITVGSTLLKIPAATFALQEDGTGGLIIDSGTSITYLEERGFNLLKKAFKSQMNLSEADGSDIGLDLCFSLPSDVPSTVEVPGLTFHFEGVDLELPADNYMVADSNTQLLCVAILGTSGMSIFGNFQQQNMQILYDLKNENLSIMPVNCEQL